MRKQSLIPVITLFLFILRPSFIWADKIIFKNGNTLEGKIVAETEDYVILSILGGEGKTKIKKSG